MKNWDNVVLVPEFDEQGVACYRLEGGDYENEYYVISEAESRKLLNTPEIVGYEVYNCLVSSTSQMLYYLKEQKKVTTANILSILRGALNYPLEEACYREHIRVHDISFLSSERVFEKEEIAGLEIKYSKLTMVPDSTLMIGDIIASGETLIHCLRYVTDFTEIMAQDSVISLFLQSAEPRESISLRSLLQRSVNSGRSSKLYHCLL